MIVNFISHVTNGFCSSQMGQDVPVFFIRSYQQQHLFFMLLILSVKKYLT